MALTLTIAGSGDAFGTGGRMQTAFVLDVDDETVLLDCGATTTTALSRIGRDPNAIGTIVISHLHGDHFGGLPWLLIQAMYATRRTSPLRVFGPAGIEARFVAAAEALFPGSSRRARGFDLAFTEMEAGSTIAAGPLQVTPFLVSHPSGAPSHALRLRAGDKTVAFSGDSEWVDTLVDCGRASDLYIMECYRYETPAPYHLTWTVIRDNLDRIGAKRILLTHMSADMLARRGEVRDPRVLLAEDGMVITI